MATHRDDDTSPLDAARVVNLGGKWAGRGGAMLLADRGADVVEIVRPHRPAHAYDGWAFIGCRREATGELARAVDSPTEDEAAIAERVPALSPAQLRERLRGVAGASAVPVTSLEEFRGNRIVATDQTSPVPIDRASLRFVRVAHPSGCLTTLPLPTWHRAEQTPVRRLFPARWPGAHTAGVLREAGCSDEEARRLIDGGAAFRGWHAMEHYLPS